MGELNGDVNRCNTGIPVGSTVYPVPVSKMGLCGIVEEARNSTDSPEEGSTRSRYKGGQGNHADRSCDVIQQGETNKAGFIFFIFLHSSSL